MNLVKSYCRHHWIQLDGNVINATHILLSQSKAFTLYKSKLIPEITISLMIIYEQPQSKEESLDSKDQLFDIYKCLIL